MVSLVCPNCTAVTTVGADAAADVCPKCGHPLAAAADVGVADTSDCAADEGLIATLQEAFELDAAALRSPGACRLYRSANSSAIASRCLSMTALAPGSHLGDFEIIGELGRGGMGIVYRARQLSLGRTVALKVLPGRAQHGRTAVRRFQAEAQAAARLHHTNIVPVYAQGQHDGHFFYAMELVEGVGLDAVIHSQPELLSSTRLRGAEVSPASQAGASPTTPGGSPRDESIAPPEWTTADYRHVAALLAGAADALDCAHRSNVIHRDVKPHNLLLGTNNRLHLTDFGLARLTDAPHLTIDGEVMGTPAYLSPEQVRGDSSEIDHRTDIYSLGVTLYEVLTRRKPFDGQTRDEILATICRGDPPAPRRLNPRIPIELETICLRAIEKDPARRHPSAAVLGEDLRRFSQGRPILSRRVSLPAKALRWAARHKALATAVVAIVAVGVLSTALAWSASAARHREAARLVRDAYEKLAYTDYHQPQRVQADVERAASLGADTAELLRVQALACLGASDQPGALRYLEACLQQDPADQRAQYLLAWAQARSRQYAAARAAFEHAERIGPPTAPDAWFFRGLAIHFDDPKEAIESYRHANALRAREHAIYPQAVLHLARARNQQLYRSRSLDGFADADASLRQLIEHQQYGAYPYYLLSIAHRLAAEIYSGSEGTRGDALVTEHYAQALEWARAGQQVEPANDRPITAEAECLESMGRYAEALAARTRAIEVAAAERERCEGHHYRWRLHYWTGAPEAALADVAVHAECDPRSRFYAHVYPALILAEMGDMPAALAHARALASETPGGAQDVLWSATCLCLLGRPDEAEALLAARAGSVDSGVDLVPPQSEEWVRALYDCCLGNAPFTTLEALAAEVDGPWRLSGEAHFHHGALQLARGDRTAALASFQRAYRSFDSELRYTFHAKLAYIRMEGDPSWPAWIATPSGEPKASPARGPDGFVAPESDNEGGAS